MGFGDWLKSIGQEYYDRTTASTTSAMQGAYNLKEASEGNLYPIIQSTSLGDGVGNSGQSIDSQNPTLDPTGYSQSAFAFENQMKLDELERNFNSAEAQKNRDWQEMMSNTSYQRAVKDLQVAGLNPWLALNGGSFNGASTPSGAQASSSSGSASTPNAAIFKAYLQLISSLVGSASSVLKAFL